MWAGLDQNGSKGNALYAARLSALSAWTVGQKRGWWKGVKGGDLGVVVMGLAVLNALVTRDQARGEESVDSRVVRWTMEILRGDRELGMAPKVEGEKKGKDRND